MYPAEERRTSSSQIQNGTEQSSRQKNNCTDIQVKIEWRPRDLKHFSMTVYCIASSQAKLSATGSCFLFFFLERSPHVCRPVRHPLINLLATDAVCIKDSLLVGFIDMESNSPNSNPSGWKYRIHSWSFSHMNFPAQKRRITDQKVFVGETYNIRYNEQVLESKGQVNTNFIQYCQNPAKACWLNRKRCTICEI